MAKVPQLQQDLYEEELKTGAAASEDTMQKVAGSVNFWNGRFQSGKTWPMNGPMWILPFPIVGVDQALFIPANSRIFAFGMMLNVPGTVGELEIDLLRHPVDLSPPVSLFTVRPKIDFSAGPYARFGIDYSTGAPVVLVNSGGTTLPTFTSLDLDAGEFLTMNLINAPTGSESATIALEVRPR